jgi:hypothetical protein
MRMNTSLRAVISVAAASVATLANLATPATPADGLAATSIEKRTVMFFEPWQAINNNVAMSQNYHDMPLARALDNDPVANLRAEALRAAAYGCDTFASTIACRDGWAWSEHFTLLLRALEGTGLKAFPSYVRIMDTDTDEKRALDFMRKWAGHPAWLRVGGAPVWSTFWADQRGDAGTYRRLRERLEKAGLRTFIVGDPVSGWDRPVTEAGVAAYSGSFDLVYSFGELGRAGKQSPADAYRLLGEASRRHARAGGWMAGIEPGYLGGWYSGRNDYYLPFRNLDQWLDSWESALAAMPDWIQWITWNDKDETHVQPTLFQWETLLELGAWHTRRWRADQRAGQQGTPPDERRLYAAYPREQLAGTVQRIEIVSLPGHDNRPVTVRGELRAPDGRPLATLPERTLAGDKLARTDWAVDTTDLAIAPLAVPVLNVDGVDHTLPAILFRSGWIQNQTTLKIPLRRAATPGSGQATLTLDTSDPGTASARLEWEAPEPLRSITLFRNDWRMGEFETGDNPARRAQVMLSSSRPVRFRATVAGGTVLRARRSSNNNPAALARETGEIRGLCDRGFPIAVELAVAPGATLHFATPAGAETGNMRVADALAADGVALPVGQSGLSLRAVRADALADERRDLPADAPRILTLALAVDGHRANDTWHARLETASGKIIESNYVHPLAKSPPVEIRVIRTPFSMDMHRTDACFSTPPVTRASVVTTRVHPAILQESAWDFSSETNPGRDTADRSPLTLGRGNSFLSVDAARVPLRIAGGGPAGAACLEFDGVDDRAQLTVQNEPKGPFTISFDLYPAGGNPASAQNILGAEEQKTGAIEIVRLADGRLRAGRTGVGFATSPRPVPADTWTRVEAFFTGDRFLLRLDGSEVASVAAGDPGFRRFGNSRLYLGGKEKPLRGRLANVSVSGFAIAR